MAPSPVSSRRAGELLWSPSERVRDEAQITRWRRWLEAERGLAFVDYGSLWRWSVSDLDAFWGSIWEYFGLGDGTPPEAGVLAGSSMPGARWFPGARLNYAERVFAGRDDDQTAIVSRSEAAGAQELTWGELRARTAALAGGLRELGVGPGDRVAAYLPAVPEATASFLAVASLGAIWSSCSPDFGARSAIDRFSQIQPKVLLAADGYRYGGRDFDRLETVGALQAALPTLERTVVLPLLGRSARGLASPWMPWSELERPGDLRFATVDFDQPLWILYSSGTTGLPKPIVHGHGGVLIEHAKTLHLHLDLGPADRFLWFTTTGWMMWNLLTSGLLTGAAIVLYDGEPTPDGLWDVVVETGVTVFGTSAGWLTACMKAGTRPTAGRDLTALRGLGSTGSPLPDEGFDWVYEHVDPNIWLFSTSGGTDICSGLVGGCPTLPVHRGELQCRALGAAVQAFDADGRAVIGQVGELVVTQPLPSMPLYFWGDRDGSRYREAYFSMFSGVWRHGDWIEITERGTAIIFGRSDSTINRGGVRMGTSEIYRSALAFEEIVDALVVDVPIAGSGSWMPLFVVLREGAELDERLRSAVCARIRADCSPRHVPSAVIAVESVPKTLTGKVLEVPVKRILGGTPSDQVISRDALADPAGLEGFLSTAAQAMARATPSAGADPAPHG